MLEHALVAHGAPTLAGLKPGSLFSIFYEEMQALAEEISALNAILVPRGLQLRLSLWRDSAHCCISIGNRRSRRLWRVRTRVHSCCAGDIGIAA